MQLPTISIIIPTLNSGKTLNLCLDSVINQDYSKDKIQIIITDGGSTDNTLNIVKSRLSGFNYQLADNPLKTGESGKAVGLKLAKKDIIGLIDSDNILPQTDWLKRMVEPFDDQEIVAVEPLYYTYRSSDPYITRYCALIGMNDPLCLFLGNYDRYCTITHKWTETRLIEQDKGDYIKIEFPDTASLPTIGANGFFIRKSLLSSYFVKDYLFDMDIIYSLLRKPHDSQSDALLKPESNVRIAKTKIGIVHLFSGNSRSYFTKQTRRIRDYYYFRHLGLRMYPWDKIKKWKILKFIFSTVLIYPLLIQTLKGYSSKRDSAWFYHPIACWLTCAAYGLGMFRHLISINPHSRTKWKQA